MLTWIQTQAKWVIVIGIVFISAGLLLVDQQSLQTQTMDPVAVIDGDKIEYSEFHSQYINRVRGLGGQDSEQDKAQLRRRILNEYAQRKGIQKVLSELDIQGSDIEAYQYVLFNPPPQVKQIPQFQTDSVFDIRKWQAFYMSDSSSQMQGLRGLEAQVKANNIPINQLNMLVALGVQTTDLEARFKISNAKNRYKLQYLSVALDSFQVPEATDAEVQEYFAQAKDSFYVTQAQAQAEMVYLPIAPTEQDFEVQKEIAQDFLHEIKNGVPFAQVALNSDDEATASQGGSLGDYQLGLRWPQAVREAAFKLDSGEVSGVVRSRLGYHVIMSHGTKEVNGEKLVKASHILTKVIAGTETMTALKDSLEAQAEALSEAEDWATYAKANGLEHKTTSWFTRGQSIDEGYFSGLSSHIFNTKSQAATSDVISNENYVAIFKKAKLVQAGERLMEPHVESIRATLKKQKQQEAAKKFLAQLKPQVPVTGLSKFAASQAQVELDTTDYVGLESSVARFGFANPKVAQIFKASKGEWTQVETDRYAFLARWVDNQEVLDKQYAVELPRTKQNLNQRSQQMAATLWMSSLIDQAVIEEDLYRYYSE